MQLWALMIGLRLQNVKGEPKNPFLNNHRKAKIRIVVCMKMLCFYSGVGTL